MRSRRCWRANRRRSDRQWPTAQAMTEAMADAMADDGAGPNVHRRPLFRAGMDDPVAVEEIKGWLIGEQIHVRLPVGLHGSDVNPLAREGIGKDAEVVGHHFWNDVNGAYQ